MQRLLRGKVVFHGPDGDECWHSATELNRDISPISMEIHFNE